MRAVNQPGQQGTRVTRFLFPTIYALRWEESTMKPTDATPYHKCGTYTLHTCKLSAGHALEVVPDGTVRGRRGTPVVDDSLTQLGTNPADRPQVPETQNTSPTRLTCEQTPAF